MAPMTPPTPYYSQYGGPLPQAKPVVAYAVEEQPTVLGGAPLAEAYPASSYPGPPPPAV